MEIAVVWTMVLMLLGIGFGMIFGFKIGESRLDKVKRAGYLVMDMRDEVPDLYLQIGADLKEFTDGEWVLMKISQVKD